MSERGKGKQNLGVRGSLAGTVRTTLGSKAVGSLCETTRGSLAGTERTTLIQEQVEVESKDQWGL